LQQKFTTPEIKYTLQNKHNTEAFQSFGCIMLWGHHIAALFPLSVLCFTSQQHSLAASISVSLPKRTFGAPASETTSAGHAYQLCHLTNGEANQRAELGIKQASFPSSSISSAVHTTTIQADTSEQSTLKTYQEGGNYVRPPGHNASWTGHYITQQCMLTASTQLQHIPRSVASPANHIQDIK
jgi:hypothetical protein